MSPKGSTRTRYGRCSSIMSLAILLVEPTPPMPMLRASKLQFCAKAGTDLNKHACRHTTRTTTRLERPITFALLIPPRGKAGKAYHACSDPRHADRLGARTRDAISILKSRRNPYADIVVSFPEELPWD